MWRVLAFKEAELEHRRSGGCMLLCGFSKNDNSDMMESNRYFVLHS
jgi:hypothetical protein